MQRSEATATNSAYGYTSSDGTVAFTAREIAKLEEDAYALKQVYGMICELAESGWLSEKRPEHRKQAIHNTIMKRHREKVSKQTVVPQNGPQDYLQRERDRDDEQKRWVEEQKLAHVERMARRNGGIHHEETEESKDAD